MFNRKKTYKDIEASRNRRLWITNVGIPGLTLMITAYSNPEIRRELKKVAFKTRTKLAETKQKVKNFFKKDKKESES